MRADVKTVGQFSGSDQREAYTRPGRDPQLAAWIVLWIAFGVFWLLVIGFLVGAKRYYDTASVARSATLSLEQGIILFRDAVSSTLVNAHDGLSLREGDELLVGQGARASLSLFDGSKVRLYSGSDLQLKQLRGSRFHDGFTRIGLRLDRGTARVVVEAPPTRSNRFLVATPHGSVLLAPGDFGLEVSEPQTRVSSRAGAASATANGESMELRAGEKGLLGRNGMAGPLPEGDELVANGDFRQGLVNWGLLDLEEPGRGGSEPGKRMLVTERIDSREAMALRILRVSRLATHNETGVTQVLNKDVLDYRSLQLRAHVRVDEQSLSGGGYMGYEYPIMLRVRYRDEAGMQTDWTVGFFHKNPENRPTPNGEGVSQAQWVPFNVDLMQAKPKPAYIISIDALASGHSFDGMIANLGLIGK